MIILGLVIIFWGALMCADTLVWHSMAASDYIGYSIYEAQIRMQAYEIELTATIVFVLAGAVFLMMGLIKRGGIRRRRCPACGSAVQKRQHFCGDCGCVLGQNVHSVI